MMVTTHLVCLLLAALSATSTALSTRQVDSTNLTLHGNDAFAGLQLPAGANVEMNGSANAAVVFVTSLFSKNPYYHPASYFFKR